MRIERIHIKNYRSLHDVELEFTDVTVLLGSNGTGKSSVLTALDWFFIGGDLEDDDITAGVGRQAISVEVTFTQLDEQDRESLGRYGTSEEAAFTRTWHPDLGVKLTGRARAFAPFENIRNIDGARELTQKYRELRDTDPALELPSVNSKSAALAAMDTWEQNHPDRLDPATVSATHLFGFAGTAKLAGRFGYTLVSATEQAASATEDSRGTILAQLVERAVGHVDIDAEIASLKESFETHVTTLLTDEYAAPLRSLERAVALSLQQYVGRADVHLSVSTTEVRPPIRKIVLHATDGDHQTDVSRQGQGFQRALLIAVLQELAGLSQVEKSSSLLIAIEEPELYQHPTQARHFASVLRSLAADRSHRLQVIYATHSPYFVDPGTFENVRRMSKTSEADCVRTTRCTHASLSTVSTLLSDAGLDDASYVDKTRAALSRALGEVLFADAVLLVEGTSDAALMRGLADRTESLDSIGVACAAIGGKTSLPIAIAVLHSLGIPVFVVFDADNSQRNHLDASGEASADQRESAIQAKRFNRILLSMLDADADDWPNDFVGQNQACFGDCLESFLKAQWREFMEFVDAERERTGVRTPKPPHIYELAAREATNAPPHLLQIIEGVKALAVTVS